MNTISIKNVFVCLDREMFAQNVKEKLTPTFEYEKEYKGNITVSIIRLIVMCIAALSGAIITISNIKSNRNIFCVIVNLLFCLLWVIYSILDLRRSIHTMEIDTMVPAIGNAFVSYVKEVLSNMSFDDLVQDTILLNIGDMYYFVWLVYNTTITGITYYEDTKKITVKFTYEDTTDSVELNIMYANDVEDLDSISIVKDGLIVNNHNNVKAHSIMTITLS